MSSPNSSKVAVLVDHISRLLTEHRTAFALKANASITTHWLPPPLFVALQGPQGIGKTTLTNSLVTAFASTNSDLLTSSSRTDSDGTAQAGPTKLAVLSLDDFYLPHQILSELASSSKNVLFQGRGLPGTHDVGLLKNVLEELYHINDVDASIEAFASDIDASTPQISSRSVKVPRYDKSAFDGQGDREPESSVLTGPLDVVLLEGWCMGFYPTPNAQLQRTWNRLVGANELAASPDAAHAPEDLLQRAVIRRLEVTIEDVEQINELLGDYVDCVYPYFTGGFIQLAPPSSQPYSLIYRWRLEQEHSMKAKNGGRGMSDEQVERFIDRYIPAYIFFGEGVLSGHGEDTTSSLQNPSHKTPWEGNGVRLALNGLRDVAEIQAF